MLFFIAAVIHVNITIIAQSYLGLIFRAIVQNSSSRMLLRMLRSSESNLDLGGRRVLKILEERILMTPSYGPSYHEGPTKEENNLPN